jgi:hypothetical protein
MTITEIIKRVKNLLSESLSDTDSIIIPAGMVRAMVGHLEVPAGDVVAGDTGYWYFTLAKQTMMGIQFVNCTLDGPFMECVEEVYKDGEPGMVNVIFARPITEQEYQIHMNIAKDPSLNPLADGEQELDS